MTEAGFAFFASYTEKLVKLMTNNISASKTFIKNVVVKTITLTF